jgi:hypothetical protein
MLNKRRGTDFFLEEVIMAEQEMKFQHFIKNEGSSSSSSLLLYLA